MGNLNCKKSDEEILAAEEDGNPLDRSRHDLSLSQLPSSEEPNGNIGNKYDLDSGINNTTTSSPNLTAHGYDRPSIGDLFPNLKGSTQLSDEFDLYDTKEPNFPQFQLDNHKSAGLAEFIQSLTNFGKRIVMML